MKFWLEDLQVYFPFTYIYPEQYEYMLQLKRALDAKGPCVLEMPSGTGKTVSLLSLITSYQLQHPEIGKLIYCSRTVAEIEKVVEEAKRVLSYRDQELGVKAPKTLCLALSSRRNLCIHPIVSEAGDSTQVDSGCRSLTASWIREKAQASASASSLCNFYENFDSEGKDALLSGVYSLEDLKDFGMNKGWCPYFLGRHLIEYANIIVYSYQYLIDPRISDMVSKELKPNAIVVFDEAHNIDNVCIEALSVNITSPLLESSIRALSTLTTELSRQKATNETRLKEEYNRLLDGLARTGIARLTDEVRGEPVLSQDVLNEVVPGNIRKSEHFVGLLKRFIEYLKIRIKVNQAVVEPPAVFFKGMLRKDND